jgi:hypothetical protein
MRKTAKIDYHHASSNGLPKFEGRSASSNPGAQDWKPLLIWRDRATANA